MGKFLTAALLLISQLGFGQPKGYTNVVDETVFRKHFIETANTINTIKCNFTQEKNLSMLSEKILSGGDFYFKKPNLVRMEYTHPYKYLLVINNEKVSIRDAEKTNNFSTKSNKLFEQINKIILDCVQGSIIDNKDFSFKLFENEKEFLVKMTPRKKQLKEFFADISLSISKKDYSLTRLNMTDESGDNTLINFVNTQFNTVIPDATFIIR